ncbi:MAG TPA: hypothetical protein DCX21_01215 [Eubacterium sp.]|nr:hypothetical protein [Eubacterium sp.]
MLNKNKIIKIGLIASLMVLVVVCALVFSKKDGKVKLNPNTDSKVLSTWDMDMTPQKKDIASWQSFVKKDDVIYIVDDERIFKWDYKSVGFRPACDDPACEHNGEECPAYFPNTRYYGVTYYNDHWVFVEKGENNRYYLGYCDFDGNNRKRVIDISDDIQGTGPLVHMDFVNGYIYMGYNSSVIHEKDSDGSGGLEFESAVRTCLMKYDVSLIGSGKDYSQNIFLLDVVKGEVVQLSSVVDEERFVVDVPETRSLKGWVPYMDYRIYNQEDKSFVTVRDVHALHILPNGRYTAMTKDGLILVDGDKTIRLDGENWADHFYDDNRIYATNMQERDIAIADKNAVIPDGEVRVYDYDGNLVDHIYMPKDCGEWDMLAAYDGRYYFTCVDIKTRSYFYVYDTQNPDKGWKKINREY